MFTAVAIVRERERGNLELLNTTPASSFELTIGKPGLMHQTRAPRLGRALNWCDQDKFFTGTLLVS